MSECDGKTGNSPVVPRSMAPHAPENSLFPSVPFMEHDWYCERDVRYGECSCGLWQLRLERGDFVRYDASMCQVDHQKGSSLPAAKDNLEVFLKLLAKKAANVDMDRFDRED